ncbi:hypothetical protein GCM10027018_15810 [Paenibacillus thermoaerophilus]
MFAERATAVCRKVRFHPPTVRPPPVRIGATANAPLSTRPGLKGYRPWRKKPRGCGGKKRHKGSPIPGS